MNIMEKNVCIRFNDSVMTISFDTFLSIIFENIKTEICYYDDVGELDDKLKLIQELNLINDENKSCICINFNDEKIKIYLQHLQVVYYIKQILYVIMF